MYPHRIRLAGPWKYEVLTSRKRERREDDRPPVAHASGSLAKVNMPCRWRDSGLAGFTGTVRFTRRFGYPGRIDDYERVWLTFAAVAGQADVCLNGTALGCIDGPAEFEVTQLLTERNLLQVDIEGSGSDAGLWGEVALEVRRTAFLRNLRITATDGLQVSGEVAGHADGPLELYVVLDRANVAYALVEPGKPFQVTGSLVGLEDSAHPTSPHTVRVDLVQGASIWHREERTIQLGEPAA